MWVVVGNEAGSVRPVYMGELGPPGWRLMTGEINRIAPPFHVVSVQIYEPGFGPVGTPGAMVVDNLHVRTEDGGEIPLESFEGELRWTPIVTAPLSSDRLVLTPSNVQDGNTAARFSFGRENQRGIRGFYQSPTAGPLPVIVSDDLADSMGAVEGSPALRAAGPAPRRSRRGGRRAEFPDAEPRRRAVHRHGPRQDAGTPEHPERGLAVPPERAVLDHGLPRPASSSTSPWPRSDASPGGCCGGRTRWRP